MWCDLLKNCSDTFDENTPPVDDPEYISSLGAAIYNGMQSGDSDAVWLMQVKFQVLPFTHGDNLCKASIILINGQTGAIHTA